MKHLVNLTMFKSGTHLIRNILSDLVKLNFKEPEIVKGKNNYEDQNKFFLPEDGFFSWHLFPYNKTILKLNNNDTKNVLLVRNLFDQTLSIYDHFRLNIDSEINRGRNVQNIFANLSLEQGIKFIIDGGELEGFRWLGMMHQYKHMYSLFNCAEQTNSILITYENLVTNKEKVICDIANFLNVSNYDLNQIISYSSFEYMKVNSSNNSHFNSGKIGRIFREEYYKLLPLFSIAKNFQKFKGYEYLTSSKYLYNYITQYHDN